MKRPHSGISHEKSTTNQSSSLVHSSISPKENFCSAETSTMTSRKMSVPDVSCQTKDRQGKKRMRPTENTYKMNNTSQVEPLEGEVDSRDTLPVTNALHVDLPTAKSSSTTTTSFPSPVTPRKAKLTLSAFRRPEETVRLTDCDASRLLENEYNLRAPGCQVIGHGAFSTVRSAIQISNGRKVAIKSISKFDALRARRLRRGGSRHMDEWEIMRLLKKNPHVLTLLDVFETNEEIHLITEYCEGGELFNAIKQQGSKINSYRNRGRYSEAQAARITNQILRALVELHSHGIVHRDIKPENIFLLNRDESDIQVKLGDFGCARLSREAFDNPSDGESSPATPALTNTSNPPPEIGKGRCGTKADVYSLGVSLYIILCGFPPVFCEDVVEFPEAYWSDVSADAKSILRSMLHSDPCQRISAAEALNNPWVCQRVRSDSVSTRLDCVRSQLYKTIDEYKKPVSPTKRRHSSIKLSPRKKRLSANALSIALTELYSV